MIESGKDTWILPKQLHTLAYALDTEALSLGYSESSEICAQSLFVRSKPLQLRIWSQKWKRDSWTQHLYGRILKPSLGNHFVTEWISSLAATHASLSVQQDREKEKMTQDICGLGLQREFNLSDQGSVFLKTSKDISAWGCPTSSRTWQEWVIERRGAYSQRLKSAHRTRGNECSSWHTAKTSDSTAGRPNDGKNRIGKNGQKFGINLSDKVIAEKNWPTPDASNHRDGETLRKDNNLEQGGFHGISLHHAMTKYGHPAQESNSSHGSRQELWATPRSGKTTDENPETWKARQENGGVATMPLTAQVKQWGSPRTGIRSETHFTYDRGKHNIKEQAGASMKGGGKLNPRWVETLMGLPLGWTIPSCAFPVRIEPMNSDCLEME